MNASLSSSSGFAPDAVFPQREVLLDRESMARRFSTVPALRRNGEVTHCVRSLVKYRVGESLRLLYRLSCQEAEYLVSARAFPPGTSAAEYEKVAATDSRSAAPSAIIYAPDLETLFWTFPDDRKLSGISVLLSPPTSGVELVGPQWHHSRLVAYTPEKGATVQCLSATGDVLAYAKMYGEDTEARSVRNHCSLYASLPTDDPYLQLPRPLGYMAQHRVLFLAPQHGPRLRDLPEATLPAGMETLGAAVARFHQLPPPPVVSRFTRLDNDHLLNAATCIGQVRLDVAASAAELAHILVTTRPSQTRALVCLHGDLHSKNGILQPDRLALVDLDQVALGDAAVEVGSFLAELHYWCCLGRVTPQTRQMLQAAFLRGYARVSPLPEVEALRWSIAAALLVERALRVVSRVREVELAYLPSLLEQARALVAGGSNV